MAAQAPQSQSQSQSQSQPQAPLSAEEEALKRNTDCVYFLASPLTCKKGGECEYRHSDIARVNPRDCWYWLNSNCLNPNCAFRHPPLDGLLGSQVPTSTVPSGPVSQALTAPTPHISNAPNKPVVQCKFFQHGFCLKGDWCPFLHGTNPAVNKASSVPGTASTAEPAPPKKAFAGLEKLGQQKTNASVNAAAKHIKDSPQVKPVVEVKSAQPRNEVAINRRVQPRTSGISEFSGYRSTPPVSNGNPASWSGRVQPSHLMDEPESMNCKDAEEVSREPSPGFDVLVDDEGRESDYYPGEDGYGMSREHESRNDINYIDYDAIAHIDDERYKDPIGYDSHEHHKGQYAWETRRSSSERQAGGSYCERRPFARPDSQVDELDLRHRLAKHKKPDGLRSVINPEYYHDAHVGDRSHHVMPRDDLNLSQRENSISSRLQGRIRLPGRSSPPTDNRGRLSPRTNSSFHQGRIRDRITGRVEESFVNGGHNHRGLHSRRDAIAEGDNVNFTGPKSLAELKNRKNVATDVTDQQSLGKRKHLMLDGQRGAGDISFEGPKPLQEILKRKRGEITGTVGGGNSCNSENNNNQKEEKDATNNETFNPIENKEEVNESNSIPQSKPETQDGIQNGIDQETEANEQRGGESDYEQLGGEDYEYYEGEDGEAVGEEYLDEEDDDEDFAKKMGVMMS